MPSTPNTCCKASLCLAQRGCVTVCVLSVRFHCHMSSLHCNHVDCQHIMMTIPSILLSQHTSEPQVYELASATMSNMWSLQSTQRVYLCKYFIHNCACHFVLLGSVLTLQSKSNVVSFFFLNWIPLSHFWVKADASNRQANINNHFTQRLTGCTDLCKNKIALNFFYSFFLLPLVVRTKQHHSYISRRNGTNVSLIFIKMYRRLNFQKFCCYTTIGVGLSR